MSCEKDAGRLARLKTGITQLAGKRGFYAGLSLAGAGLLGAGLVAFARRLASAKSGRPPLIDPNRVPDLPERKQVKPDPARSAGGTCTDCQTSSQRRSGAWYTIDGQRYCQECAPAAAQKADVELVRPAQNGRDEGSFEGDRLSQRSTQKSRTVGPDRALDTRLEPSRIGLNIGSREQPARFVVEGGYVLLRPDGSDTGLALTPDLDVTQAPDGQVQVTENPARWWLTHIPSGRTLVDRPYASPSEAQQLGSRLANIDWRRDETDITPTEYQQARSIVASFNQALGETKSEVSPPVFQSSELTGKLVADNYGGVSRVLAEEGNRLFLIDSLGKRYEVERHEIRAPKAQDFELCRVVMPFNPASQPDASCAACNRTAGSAPAGEPWHKMGWQCFCGACSESYAANEGYLKAEEIGLEPEPHR